MSLLPADLRDWLRASATSLDEGAAFADEVTPRLGAAGVFARGVPRAAFGEGGDLRDALRAIVAVARESLAAGFVFWGQRAFIEYLLNGASDALREHWLADLLSGRAAGATGLSNAMKFLSGLEGLQVRAVHDAPRPGVSRLSGRVPWATNLRRERFLVAVAVESADGRPARIAALDSAREGVARSADLDLIALRGSNTASVEVCDVVLERDDWIAGDAPAFLPAVRPAFLGLQCGLSIGVAHAALEAADRHVGAAAAVLRQPIDETRAALDDAVETLEQGLVDRRFHDAPADLFRLRIRLARLAQTALGHELSARGGRAYHRDADGGFARRWREAAFLPVITPTLVQLEGELARAAAREPVGAT